MWVWAEVMVVLVGVVGVWANPHPAHTLTRKDLTRPHRIVGGDPVKQGQLPWQVSLQYNGRHFCGGTLIAPTIVATAAHCTKVNLNQVRIVTGAWDLNEKCRKYTVAKTIVNDYNSKTFERDIAVLQMGKLEDEENVRDLPNGQPISLETRKEHGDGERCTISGWGKMGNSDLPHILRAADVVIRSDSECRGMFKYQPFSIFSSNLCAGGGEEDACQGDSGGPLVCCKTSTSDVGSCRLAGITSWGIGCATRGIPGVYTEVAHYVDWIKEAVKKEFGEEDARSLSFFEGNADDDNDTNDDD